MKSLTTFNHYSGIKASSVSNKRGNSFLTEKTHMSTNHTRTFDIRPKYVTVGDNRPNREKNSLLINSLEFVRIKIQKMSQFLFQRVSSSDKILCAPQGESNFNLMRSLGEKKRNKMGVLASRKFSTHQLILTIIACITVFFTANPVEAEIKTFRLDAGQNGLIKSDGVSTSYPEIYGFYSASFTGHPQNFSYAIVEEKNGVELKSILIGNWGPRENYLPDDQYPRFKGSETRDEFAYGNWYISDHNPSPLPACDAQWCYNLLFIPDAVEINKLKPTDSVVYTYSAIFKNCLSAQSCVPEETRSFKVIINPGAVAIWSQDIKTDDEGHAVLTTESNTATDDITSTLIIAKPDGSRLTLDSIKETINGGSEMTGDGGKISTSFPMFPAGYDSNESFAYGSGQFDSNKKLRYGFWILDKKNGLLLFRPDYQALQGLNSKDLVSSRLGLSIVTDTNGNEEVIGTYYFQVTIKDNFPENIDGGISIRWNTANEFDEDGIPAITGTGSTTTLPDITGFMETDFNQILSGGQATSINKWRFSLYEDTTPDTDADVPPIDEAILNNPNPKWNVNIETSGVEEVTELEGTETKVGESMSYGNWYIREDDGYGGVNYLAHTSTRQFLFRPNPDVVGKLEAGSSVRSYLRIQKGWCNVINFPRNKDCPLHTSQFDGEIDSAVIIAVTISVSSSNPSANVPVLSIAGARDGRENGYWGQTTKVSINAEFIVTSDIQPLQTLTVRYKPENEVGDFITEPTNPSYSEIDLTFSLDSNSMQYVADQRISIPIIDDDVEESTGAVKVTLFENTTDDEYDVAAAESENSAQVKVFDDDLSVVSMTKGDTTASTLKLNFAGINYGACIKLNVTQGNSLIESVDSDSTIESTTNGSTYIVHVYNNNDRLEPVVTVTVGDSANGTVAISLESNDDSCEGQNDFARDYTAAANQVVTHTFDPNSITMTKGATTATTLKLNFAGLTASGACIKLNVTQGNSLITNLASDYSSSNSGNVYTVLTRNTNSLMPVITVTVASGTTGTVAISIESNSDTSCHFQYGEAYTAAANQVVTHTFGPTGVTMTKGATTDTTLKLNFTGIASNGACIKLNVTQGNNLITSVASTATAASGGASSSGSTHTVLTLDNTQNQPIVTITVGNNTNGIVRIALASNSDTSCHDTLGDAYAAAANQVVTHTFGTPKVSMTKGETTDTMLKLNFTNIADAGACIKLNVTQGASLISRVASEFASRKDGNTYTVLTRNTNSLMPVITVTAANGAAGTVEISLESNSDTSCHFSYGEAYTAESNQVVTHTFEPRVTMTKGETTATTLKLNFAGIASNGACIKLNMTQGNNLITSVASTATAASGGASSSGSTHTVLTLDNTQNQPIITVSVGSNTNGTVAISLVSNSDTSCHATFGEAYVAAANQVVTHTFVSSSSSNVTMTKGETTATTLKLNFAGIASNGACIKLNVTQGNNLITSVASTATSTHSGASSSGSTHTVLTLDTTQNQPIITVTVGSNTIGTVEISLESNSDTSCHNTLGDAYVAAANQVVTHAFSSTSVPTITVRSSTADLAEAEGATTTFTFSFSGSTSQEVSIAYEVSSVSTADPGEYTIGTDSPIKIPSDGTTPDSLSVILTDDKLYEGDETIVLTLTASNAVFSDGSNTHELTVTIKDDEMIPVLSIKEAPQSIPEGTVATIRVKSSVLPAGTLSVGFTVRNMVGQFFDQSASDSSPKTMTFETVGSEFIGELAIGTSKNNVVGEENGEIRVSLDTPQSTDGYDIDDTAASTTFEVEDDTDYEITIDRESSSVFEGEDIVFTLQSDPVPVADFDVRLRVSQTGDNLAWPVKRKVRFSAKESSVSLTLQTVSSPESTGNGMVSVVVVEGEGYVGSMPVSVEVRKPESAGAETTKYSVASSVITMILKEIPPTSPLGENNDSNPILSIHTVKGTVVEGESAVFAISTSHTVNSDIPIGIKLSQSGDFVIGPMVRSVELKKDRLDAELSVDTENDELAEDDGMITAAIQYGNGYNVGSVKTAYVNVSDALDRMHRKSRISNTLHAVLPDLLMRSATRTFGIAVERTRNAFSANATTSIELNGQSPVLSMLQTGGEMLNTGDADWQSLIDDSAFSIALYPEGGEISSASVWGVGDRQRLSGEGNAGQQSWEGESLTGHFGFDARVGNNMLAGMSLSVSQSEIDYGGYGDSGMSFDTNTAGVHPYLGLNLPDGKSHVQIMAGYGVNELVLSQETYSPEYLNGSYHTVGFSGNHRILSNSFGDGHNLELSISGEAWNSHQFLTEVDGLVDDLQVSARHTRIAIEGVHDYNLSGGGTFSPSISVGLREDGRNEESIFGLDISSGIEYGTTDGLEVLASGKSLQSGLNRVHLWEIENSVNFDSGYDGRGVLFKMSRSWKGTDANTDRYIWGSELVNASDDSISFSEKSFFSTEIGYGFDVLGGSTLMVPYVGYNQTKSHGSEFQVGSRFTTITGMDFELETERNASKSGAVAHEYNLKGNINW